ncbi:isoprenoid synthase domain-containing protein, partial [Thelephora terrestris]
FTLPDLPGICQDPFSPSFNPHYDSAVASESKAWIDSLGILSGEKQTYFSNSAFEFLAAHTCPYADREGYRTSCDYLNTTFILDDYSDDEGGEGARRMADSFMNALREPAWDDGTPFAKMAREFRARLATASSTARQRFIDTFDHYLEATVREAQNREEGIILSLSDFMELRRGNSGVYPAYAIIECILSIDLQPEVFNHPALWNLTKIAGDMLFIANDIYSYNKEQAGGHAANNFITVIQKERGVDLQGAMDISGGFFAKYAEDFNTWKDQLPSWGSETDAAVSEYIKGMAASVRGYIEWSLTGPRYFGASVQEVKKTRRVLLRTRAG